jgi:hypothetical protein
MMLLSYLALLAGAPASPPEPTAVTCVSRLETARAELLRARFNPANETEKWLTVTGFEDGGLMLHVYTVYSPDGDGRRSYTAELHPFHGKPRDSWLLYQRKVLDEFKEERLPERTWTRVRAGWIARIHTRTEDRHLVDLFESVTRPALEACLDHPDAMGKIERCHYAEDQNKWVCKTW